MRRGLGALIVLVVLATGACGGGPGDDRAATPPATSGATPAGDEELEEPLEQAGGQAQADLPGLLMGGEEFTLVGEAWCGLATIQTAGVPRGASVTVTEVAVRTDGATLADADCGTPPCVGEVLDADGASCWVAVLPPGPGTEVVDVVFDATASCSTQEVCDELAAGVTLGTVWSMCHPPGDVAYDCDPATDERTEEQGLP